MNTRKFRCRLGTPVLTAPSSATSTFSSPGRGRSLVSRGLSLAASALSSAGTAATLAASAVLLTGPALLSAQTAPTLGAAEPDVPRLLTPEDQFALARVGNPRLSPDGEWVAYTVSTTDLAEESSETRIWMVSADPMGSRDAIPMTREGESASSPTFSPDGRYLSFLASWGDKTQVWVLDRRGGEATALTDVPQGVSGYEWSPDGSRLALTVRDPEPDSANSADRADSSKSTTETREPWVVNRLQFKRDGTGYLTDERNTHIYVFDTRDRSLRQITTGDRDEGQMAWSPDGRWIAFSSNRTDEPDGNADTDIWVVSADAAEPTDTFRRITRGTGSDHSPAWSPDGGSLAYVTVTEPELIWYATSHLAVAQADGSETRVLSESLDRNVSNPRFSENGQSILFEVEDSGENHLARYTLVGDQIERVVSGPLSLGDYDVGPRGQIVALAARTSHPPEIFSVRGEALARLTTVNDSVLSTFRLAEVPNETFSSDDGTEIEGFFYLPPDYEPGRRYPTLLRIHGGPVSQYSHSFNFEAQLFAANGYVVVTTNPRGSSGYSQDFSRILWADWGNEDFEDVMAGVDHAISRGWADPDRLGVGGWSYGGILTNYVVTKTDRFDGAISGASEVLYIANYGHDHYQRQWEAELGLPWEGDNREAWERISPFNQAHEIETPMLIMGGERDWNVPIQNSEQLYQVLRRRGVPTQLVVYPGQPHGLRVPSYQKDRYERYLAWYDRWVKNAPRTASDR